MLLMKLHFLMYYSPIFRVSNLFCIVKHFLYSLFNMQQKNKKYENKPSHLSGRSGGREYELPKERLFALSFLTLCHQIFRNIPKRKFLFKKEALQTSFP